MLKSTEKEQMDRVLEEEKHLKPSGYTAEKDLNKRLLHTVVKDLNQEAKKAGGY